MAAVTLDKLREKNMNVYPVGLLNGCETALLLFAAGFHGAQDGIFIADAGLRATCVDIRPDKLMEMAHAYPRSWEFVVADAYLFASDATGPWDIVSVDCPSDHFHRCAELAPRWCNLAHRAVVLGTGHDTSVTAPKGWRITRIMQRSVFAGGTYWTVLEPC